MKKVLCAILMVILCVGFVSCEFEESGYSSHTEAPKMKIGDSVTSGDFEFTVLSVFPKIVGTNNIGYGVSINIQVRNIGTSEKTLRASDMKLFHKGSEYSISGESWRYSGYFLISDNIGAKMTKTYKLLYELPENYTEDDYLQVDGPGLFAIKKIIYLSKE